MRTQWALVVLAIFWINTAAAGVGQLDPAFGSGGYVLIPFDLGSTPNDQADAVRVQPDGRILVGGIAGVGDDNRDFALARLLADGSLDASFGTDGKTTIDFNLGGFADNLRALALYPDGRILAAGTADNVDGHTAAGAWAVARLSSSGTLDTSFNLDGKVTVDIFPVSPTSGSSLSDMALLPDGRILLSGHTVFSMSDFRVTLVRLNPDGSLDTGFGTNGIRHLAVATGDPPLTFATAMTVRPDGRAIVVGFVNTNTEGGLDLEMLALQVLDDGSPDASFGSNGVSLVSFDLGAGSVAAASDVAIDAQGRIVLGGSATNLAGNLDFAAARLLPNGDLDNGFGQAGRMVVGFDLGGSLSDRAAGLAIDSDGRIYLAGSTQVAPDNDDVGVLRLRANGLIDTGFGNNGKFVFGIDNNPPVFVDDFASAIVLDGRDRPVIVGASYLGPETLNYNMLVLRLTGERLFRDRFEAQTP